MNKLSNDVKFLIRGFIYLFLFLVALNGLAQTAEASDTDGLLSYGQCIRIEKTHGNPCIHQAKTFFSVGIGSNTGNGFANGFFGHDINYAVTNKTRYATDGTPSQCTDPCQPCKGGQCKYVCKEYACTWVAADNGIQSTTVSTANVPSEGRGQEGSHGGSFISEL